MENQETGPEAVSSHPVPPSTLPDANSTGGD